MKRTLERGLKVPEIVMEEANVIRCSSQIHVDVFAVTKVMLSTLFASVRKLKRVIWPEL